MSRNRWSEWVLRGLVLGALAGLVGCKQTLFMPPDAYQDAVTTGLPPNLTENPNETVLPPVVDHTGPGVATVMDPSRPPRYVTLKECIAVALEQGNVGSQSPFIQNAGTKNELGVSASNQGAALSGADPIRAFALDPADAAASVERSLSRFDARWITYTTWQKVDQPVAAQFLSFQQQRDGAHFESNLNKPLPSGGLAGITFSVDYSKFATIPQNQASGFVNPNYTPRLAFTFEQPLLRLFGVEVNQLADDHPNGAGRFTNSFLFPTSSSVRGLPGERGILITRIRMDQARTGFEAQANYTLVNVEAAYWNLYSAYYTLFAQEEGLRQAYEGYRFTEARVRAGTDPPQQLAQSRAQLELFRAQVYEARGTVLERERQLRGLMGLRSDDGVRLVPIDEPNLAPFRPDYYDAVNEALAMRPELMVARQEVKVAQLQLRLSRALRRPDLRVFADYDVAGLGTRLDGSELVGANANTPGNAFSSLSNNQFNSWDVGIRMDVPLGFRDASATVRQAHLNLVRRYYELRDAELKAAEYLVQQHRQVVQSYAVLPALRARREALQEFVYKFRIRLDLGSYRSEEYFNYLQVQRDLADAIAREFQAVADYNKALAQFEFSKGTIMRYNNIHLTEAALPPNVSKRAADHERERVAALKLRERPGVETAPVSPPHLLGPGSGAPALPPLTEMPAAPEFGPDGLPRAAPGAGVPMPLPKPTPMPKVQPDARVAPAPVPAPGAGAAADAGMPNPDAIFTPTGGTVSVPRFQPLIVPNRGTGGTVGPSSQVPPVSPSPTVPPLPQGTSSIPPTLPTTGVPGTPQMPTPMSARTPPY